MSQKHRFRRGVPLAIGALVGAAFLFLALQGISWTSLVAALQSVGLLPLALTGLVLVLGIILRGLRWCLIAKEPANRWHVFARATTLGLLSNQLLPGRLGEFVRVFALVRLLPTSLPRSVSSAVLDRTIDVIVLLVSASWISMSVGKAMIPGRWLMGLAVLIAVLISFILMLQIRNIRQTVAAWSRRWLRRWAMQPEIFLSVLSEHIQGVTKIRRASVLIVIATAILAADLLTIAGVLLSLQLDLPWSAPVLVWVLLAVGSALPAAPGYIGTYQLAAVLALQVYAVPQHAAVAAAFVLQGATLFVAGALAIREIFPRLVLWHRTVVMRDN